MEAPPSVRVDKWLWAVRLFKTRSLAAEACSTGKVKIAGQPLKPARNIHVGEILTAFAGEITRTVKVVALLEKRVGAKLVADFMKDLTPPEAFAKPREPNFQTPFQRAKGTGRPTKKERRNFEEYFGG